MIVMDVVSFKTTLELYDGAWKYLWANMKMVDHICVDIKRAALDCIKSKLTTKPLEKLMTVLPKFLNTLASNVKEWTSNLEGRFSFIKEKLWTHKRLIANIAVNFRKAVNEILQVLSQYKAGQDLMNVYYEYQSWLEEIHFSQHVEQTLFKIQS